jgi:hypothetical protein
MRRLDTECAFPGDSVLPSRWTPSESLTALESQSVSTALENIHKKMRKRFENRCISRLAAVYSLAL